MLGAIYVIPQCMLGSVFGEEPDRLCMKKPPRSRHGGSKCCATWAALTLYKKLRQVWRLSLIFPYSTPGGSSFALSHGIGLDI